METELIIQISFFKMLPVSNALCDYNMNLTYKEVTDRHRRLHYQQCEDECVPTW